MSKPGLNLEGELIYQPSPKAPNLNIPSPVEVSKISSFSKFSPGFDKLSLRLYLGFVDYCLRSLQNRFAKWEPYLILIPKLRCDHHTPVQLRWELTVSDCAGQVSDCAG